MEKNEKNNESTFIPEDMPQFHITGGAYISTLYDIRIIFLQDEIVRGQKIDSDVKAYRKGACEIIMPPKVAKTIGKMLINEYEKYEKEFGEHKDQKD